LKYRINKLKLKNYGQVREFSFDGFSNINLIIGENGTGKTQLLKALYSAVRSLEEYHRGDDVRSINEILAEKLRWTCQVEKLGDIVSKGSDEALEFCMQMNSETLEYKFGTDCSRKIVNMTADPKSKEGNSICIPAKEVLSLYSVIMKSRDVDKVFGFDDTYYDLVRALQIAPTRGRNFNAFARSRSIVSDIIDGKVDYDDNSGKWIYKNSSNQRFSIGATSEGVKKIAIMDRLLANGYLSDNSIIFIDEIESALHPEAVCQYLDLIDIIANEMGLQCFITSHSYFVIKKLFLIALKRKGGVACISLSKDAEPQFCQMHEGMPLNSIIDTSIRLYEQEVNEVL